MRLPNPLAAYHRWRQRRTSQSRYLLAPDDPVWQEFADNMVSLTDRPAITHIGKHKLAAPLYGSEGHNTPTWS